MSNLKELREKSVAELHTEVLNIQRTLFGLRIEIAHQASENTAGLGKLRREIAQVKTVIREKVTVESKAS